MNNKMLWIIVALVLVVGGGMYVASAKQVQNPETSSQNTTVEDDDREEIGEDEDEATEKGTPEASEEKEDKNEAKDEDETNVNGNVKTFTVEGKSFSFSPATIQVSKGDTVKIVFKNTEGMHDWVNDEFNARTKQIQAGQQETIEFVADKAGSFEYYCSVGKHRQNGMKGTLVVK